MNLITVCCICSTATRWNFIEHRITLVGEHSGSTLTVFCVSLLQQVTGN